MRRAGHPVRGRLRAMRSRPGPQALAAAAAAAQPPHLPRSGSSQQTAFGRRSDSAGRTVAAADAGATALAVPASHHGAHRLAAGSGATWAAAQQESAVWQPSSLARSSCNCSSRWGASLGARLCSSNGSVAQVVELALAVDVLDVQIAVGAHRLVCGRVAAGRLLAVGVARRRSPGRGARPAPRRASRAGRSPRSSGSRLCPSLGGLGAARSPRTSGQVDVLGHRAVRRSGRHPGPDDDQRHVDVGVERRQLAGHQPVLAGVQAVVGAEHDVRVARRRRRRASVVSILPIIRSTACTDCARRRNAASISCDLARGQRRVAGQPLRRVGRQLVEVRRPRRAAGPGKSWRRAAPGCTGACGANVASSRKNGLPRRADALMKLDPVAREHVGQVVARPVAVAVRCAPFCVQSVVELGVAVAGDVPVGPAGRHVRGRRRAARRATARYPLRYLPISAVR